MSTNQYRGREETDKINYKNKTPEEQKKISEDKISEEQNDVPVNENLARKGKDKFQEEQSRRVA